MPSIRPEGSYAIINDPELGVSEKRYLQCVHCGMHYEVRPGSGRTRGVCLMCYGPTCGRPGCDPCVPLERRLEMWERPNPTPGKSWYQRLLEEGGRKRLWRTIDQVLKG